MLFEKAPLFTIPLLSLKEVILLLKMLLLLSSISKGTSDSTTSLHSYSSCMNDN